MMLGRYLPVILASLALSTARADGLAAPRLVPPTAKTESFTDAQGFPFVTALAGAKLVATTHEAIPLDITGPDDKEATLVGTGTINKQYEGPAGIVDDDFTAAYEKAFKAAGWTLKPLSAGGVLAHWAKNDRDLWVRVWREGGNTWNVTLTDVGNELDVALHKGCKAALYGLHFDFDKATLRPDSEPVLRRVLAVVKDEPGKLELNGFTDDVGDKAYNRRLSTARAEAVKTWLVGHGATAARLATQGHGDESPIVPNDSDANRARNRRVELAKPGCK